MDPTLKQRAAAVKLVVFDVDGVLTDGRLYFSDDGRESLAFHIRDGHGIRLLIHYGVQVAVLSARESEAVTRRMNYLGVKRLYQGFQDKGPALQRLLEECGVTAAQTAYLGDDLPDLAPMARVGLAGAVADAHPVVIECAHWVAAAAGGYGAARELCEILLKEQGKWDEALDYCRG